MRKLFVANLSFNVSDSDLNNVFAQKGRVLSARVAIDRETGRSRGFGFVEMDSSESAAAALSLSGEMVFGRELKVMEARQEERPQGSRYVRREEQRQGY